MRTFTSAFTFTSAYSKKLFASEWRGGGVKMKQNDIVLVVKRSCPSYCYCFGRASLAYEEDSYYMYPSKRNSPI